MPIFLLCIETVSCCTRGLRIPMQNQPLCPFLERRDPRCADRLSLERLAEAFSLCAGRYEHCIFYQRIRDEDQDRLEFSRRSRTA